MPHLYAYHTWDSPYRGLNGGSKPFQAARPGSSPIYGQGLQQLGLRTQANIEQLRSSLCAIDPCYALGPEFWHFKEDNSCKSVCQKKEYPPHAKPKWEESKGFFTTHRDMEMSRPRPEESESSEPVNKYCYLCTTLDEHKRHLARRGEQLKPKKKPRPRVNFIVPLPYVKRKDEGQEEENNVLYKITVRTGLKPNAATSANVFMKLRGSNGSMKERPLCKKMCVKFAFGRGTSEVFHVKGPQIGRLKWLTVRHDGLEKVHSWWLEEIEVMDMSAQRVYIFPCHQWLSLHHADYQVKRDLKAHEKELKQIEYEVAVTTAKEKRAATSANVFLTLYGKKRIGARQKLKGSEKNFAAGSTDNFNFVIDDIGLLTKIRLEQDNTGDSPDWKVEMVEIHDTERDKTYQFPCGQWLSANEKRGGQLFRELFPIGRSMEKALKHARKGATTSAGPLLSYEVTVVTGSRNYAGTDANVYLMMFGKLGKASEVQLDDHRNNFEKGMTEVFKIQAEDVGDIKRVRIRHDDTGLAAGWFLETLTIKRYLSKTEIAERLDQMETNMKEKVIEKASEITGSPTHEPKNASSMKHRGSIRRESNFAHGSDDSPRRSRPKSGYGRHNGTDSDSDAEDGRSHSSHRKSRNHSMDSDDDQYSSKKNRRKKVVSYSGIDVLVTDSDSDDDSESKRSPHRGGRKHSQKKYYSDSDENEKYYKQSNRRKSKLADSDSENERMKRRSKHGRMRRKCTVSFKSDSEQSDSDSDYKSNSRRKGMFTESGEGRIPYCDEYVFLCHQWLAKDEADGEVLRELKPKSMTTYYRVAN